jgi:hypothetical protein
MVNEDADAFEKAVQAEEAEKDTTVFEVSGKAKQSPRLYWRGIWAVCEVKLNNTPALWIEATEQATLYGRQVRLWLSRMEQELTLWDARYSSTTLPAERCTH